jgi:hypothetical protein
MWWNKTISKEEMGKKLWQFCCDSAENFCLSFRPKLQAKGFLKSPMSDRTFMDEAVKLHLWIISRMLELTNSDVLVVLNNFAVNSGIVHHQGQTSQTLRERYALYDQAASKDMELQNKGLTPTFLAKTALQYLVNNKTLDSDFIIESEVHLTLCDTMRAVSKLESDFKIR